MSNSGPIQRLLTSLAARRRRRMIRSLLSDVTLTEVTWIPPAQSPLAFKETPVRLAMDFVIGPRTLAFGHWHDEHCELVRQHLAPGRNYHLVDVGANAGLVSRQLLASPGLNFLGADCYEPDPHNFSLLQTNLAPFAGVNTHRAGLSNADGEADIFRSSRNAGDISLTPDAELRARKDLHAQRIQLLDARREGDRILAALGTSDTRLVWKSDTQGHDLKIAAALPLAFWQRVDVALIEVTSVNADSAELAAFQRILAEFPTRRSIKFGAREISAERIADFVAQGSGSELDLLLVR